MFPICWKFCFVLFYKYVIIINCIGIIMVIIITYQDIWHLTRSWNRQKFFYQKLKCWNEQKIFFFEKKLFLKLFMVWENSGHFSFWSNVLNCWTTQTKCPKKISNPLAWLGRRWRLVPDMKYVLLGLVQDFINYWWGLVHSILFFSTLIFLIYFCANLVKSIDVKGGLRLICIVSDWIIKQLNWHCWLFREMFCLESHFLVCGSNLGTL